MKKFYCAIVTSICLAVVSGCGGGSSSTDTPTATPAKGILTLGVTDAPVDDAAKVVVQFDGL